ncbi:MAG: DUF1028 domain-containing protein [Actinobacteria bacterium]|nr:DUF1028 domain-containing protein [Actinomycetota bacterium]
MTYSIVARDGVTGELGVAVQTDWFAAGTVVTWAEAGVGAVATQSFAEVSYGPLGLDRMRGGEAAPDALAALLAADPEAAVRQVGVVDASGRASAHTGDRCVQACGQAIGPGVASQANMMEKETVWGAMLDAFLGTAGPLAERLLAALEAAEREGGDARGRQSAALLVVGGERRDHPWQDRLADLRVDEHERPVEELGRLLRVHRAYEHLERGNTLTDEGRFEEAAAEMDRAAELAPEDDQISFWRALTLVGAGRAAEAREAAERARAANPRWAPFLRRLAAAGHFPDDDAVMDALMPIALPGEAER